jgi:hypothetical protein
MANHIIQFPDLDEFVSELPADHIVRVVALDVTEGTYDKVAELRIAGIGVHVRAINKDGHIMACYLPVARMQIFGRRPRKGDPDEEAYNQAWDKAAALEARVRAFLAAGGFSVRSGVIHLGEVNLLPGCWSSDPGRAVPGMSVDDQPAP